MAAASFDFSDLGPQQSNKSFDFSDLGPQQQSVQNQQPQGVLPQIGNAIYGAATGAGKSLGQDLFNTLNLIPGVNLNPNVFGAPAGMASNLGGIAGHMAGFALPGGIATKAAEAFPILSTGLAVDAIPAAQRILGQGLAGGAYGTATSPNDDRFKGGLTGLAGGVVPGAILQGAIPTAGLIKNIVTGTPNLSPEAQALQQQVGNLPVPYAAQGIYKNILSKIPFSGIGNNQQLIAGAADQKANDIANTLKGQASVGDIPSNVQNAIENIHDTNTENNNSLYQKYSDAANASNVKITQAPNMQKMIDKYGNDDQLPQKDRDILNNFSATPDMSAIGQGPSLQGGSVSLNNAHGLQKDFANKAKQAYGNNNYLGSIYSDLSNAMRNDMHYAGQQSGNDDLNNMLSTAKQDFAQNVAPYRNKQIYNVVSGKSDLNSIQNLLSKNTPEVNKVVSDLPDDVRNQVGYLKLSPAIKEDPETGQYAASAPALSRVYSSLPETQKQKLFSPDLRQEFNNLGILNQYSKGVPGSHTGGMAALEVGLPALGMFHGGIEPGLHAALGAIGLNAGARVASNLLTNPSVRNAYLSAPSASDVVNPYMSNLLSKLGVAGALQKLSANSNQPGANQ